jgi:hypothetical protein
MGNTCGSKMSEAQQAAPAAPAPPAPPAQPAPIHTLSDDVRQMVLSEFLGPEEMAAVVQVDQDFNRSMNTDRNKPKILLGASTGDFNNAHVNLLANENAGVADFLAHGVRGTDLVNLYRAYDPEHLPPQVKAQQIALIRTLVQATKNTASKKFKIPLAML